MLLQIPILKQIELISVKLPLVHPFRTSFGEEENKHAILVKITDSEGNIGWGETTVESKPGYCYETVDTAWNMQQKFLLPRLKEIATQEFTFKQLKSQWAHVRGHEFAKGGIEAALWSLIAVSSQKNLGEIYGASKEKIPTGVSIGIQKDIPQLLKRIEKFHNLGYRRIKIKIEPGWDVDVIKSIRKEFGDINLMVDANSAYSLDDIQVLQKLDQFNLMMIEQPMAYNDILMHKKLQDKLSTPLCLDESIHNPSDAKLAIEYGCCKIINIKPGRVGGFGNAIQIAKEIGPDKVWCGGMLETGIGRLHNIFLQARSEFTIPGDTSGSNRYFSPDIITPEVTVNDDGYIDVPNGPGFGFEVNKSQISKYMIKHELIVY